MVPAGCGGTALTRPGPACDPRSMNTNLSVSPSQAEPAPVPESALQDLAAAEADAWITRIALAERACCCPAKPSAVGIMPSATDRSEPIDLMLCGHHYRIYEAGLQTAGAVLHYAPRG